MLKTHERRCEELLQDILQSQLMIMLQRGDNNKGQILGIAKVKSSSSIMIKNNCWLEYSHILNLLHVLFTKKEVKCAFFKFLHKLIH